MNVPTSAMYVPQQSYTDPNGWGMVAEAVNTYNYNNSYTNNSNNNTAYGQGTGWQSVNGGVKTTDPNAINRLLSLVNHNQANNQNAAYGMTEFLTNEGTLAGRAENDKKYGEWLKEVIVQNNTSTPKGIKGINYVNGQVQLDMGIMMGSGGVLLGSGGDPNYGKNIIVTLTDNHLDPTVANAQKFFSSHFPNFKAPVGGSITFKVGEAPPNSDVYIGTNGRMYDKADKSGVSGVTRVDASGKNFTIYLDTGVFKNDYKMMETLGHELIHVHNIQDNFTMYKNEPDFFTVLSELAAYKHDVAFAKANGDTQAEISANNQIKSIKDTYTSLKDTDPDLVNFHSSYSDIPVKL